jgi:hypothetical protein
LNYEEPLGERPRSQADQDAEAEEDRQRSEIKAHWREIIREEVATEVAVRLGLCSVHALCCEIERDAKKAREAKDA